MTEHHVIEIAYKLVQQSNLNPCQFESVRRTERSKILDPNTIADEWVVIFEFIEENGACSSAVAMVVVDDATGHAWLFDSL